MNALRITFLFVVLFLPLSMLAEPVSITSKVVTQHILPGMAHLAHSMQTLADAVELQCTSNAAVKEAYHQAFDAWIEIEHLRMGPMEEDNRIYAMAFWPDPRAAGPRTLLQLVRDDDPALHANEVYARVSVAARGVHAMEYLLYGLPEGEIDEAAHCLLLQRVAQDMAQTTRAVHDGWQQSYADQIVGDADSERLLMQNLLRLMNQSLQFDARLRLGRPLGVDRPHPHRAEAWRSGRSLRNIKLSLQSLYALAQLMSHSPLTDTLAQAFARSIEQAQYLAASDSPLERLHEPQTKQDIEALQQSILALRTLVVQELGTALGVAMGFNALDGD